MCFTRQKMRVYYKICPFPANYEICNVLYFRPWIMNWPTSLVGREGGSWGQKTSCFSTFQCLLFQNLNRKSMFAALHSDSNSLKTGLLYLTVQPYCKKGRSEIVKDGIINLILRNYLADRYRSFTLNKDCLVGGLLCHKTMAMSTWLDTQNLKFIKRRRRFSKNPDF